jgi:flagellar hook assembly protein FlgD
MKLAGQARVTLYDTQGRLIRTLLPKQDLPAGPHSVRIDGLDERGKRLGSGVYFYTIETPDGESRGRFVVAK